MKTFLTIWLTLAAGVPAVLYVIMTPFDPTLFLALCAFVLMASAALGVLAVHYKEQVISSVFGGAKTTLENLVDEVSSAAQAQASGRSEALEESLKKLLQVLAAKYSWVTLRRFYLWAVSSLIVAFAGLWGSSLVLQQISLLRQQNASLQRQMFLQVATENLKIVFDDRSRPSLRVQALQALVNAKRQLSRLEGQDDSLTVDIRGAGFERAYMRSIDLGSVILADCDFSAAQMHDADLRGADLSGTGFVKTQLQQADFRGATLFQTDFTRAVLHFADFRGDTLISPRFQGAQLTKADFRGAVLMGTGYGRARFDSTDFRGADLTHAEDLSPQQLRSQLIVDETTQLPRHHEKRASGD